MHLNDAFAIEYLGTYTLFTSRAKLLNSSRKLLTNYNKPAAVNVTLDQVE